MPQVTTSLLPPARAALIALMDAATTAPVTVADPGDDRPPEGCVYTGDAEIVHTFGPMRSGRKPRDEEIDLEVFVEALDPDPTQAEQLVMTIVGQLEDIVAGDPTLGLDVTPPPVAEISSISVRIMAETEQYRCKAECGVTITTRLN